MALTAILVFRTSLRIDESELLLLSKEIFEEFGADEFADNNNFDDLVTLPIERIADPFEVSEKLPTEGYWKRLNAVSRYYWPDYRKGSPEKIKKFIQWIFEHFPSSEVWYGNDADDESFVLVDDDMLEKLEDQGEQKR